MLRFLTLGFIGHFTSNAIQDWFDLTIPNPDLKARLAIHRRVIKYTAIGESKSRSVIGTDNTVPFHFAFSKRPTEMRAHLSHGRRFFLVEAAQVTVRSDSEWRSKFFHLAMRRGRKIAKVAMARRLAVRLF